MYLHRPLIFFDLETTGTNTAQDRIVQIGAIKIQPVHPFGDGTREEKNILINPGIPIPAGATAVHGISDEDVKDAPVFRRISKAFGEWLSGLALVVIPMDISFFGKVFRNKDTIGRQKFFF